MAADTSQDGMALVDTKAAAPTPVANMAGTGDNESQVLQPNVMKHNDLQLQELLRLARSCLKHDRLPGELSERGFFDKFQTEHDSLLAEQSLLQDSTRIEPGEALSYSSISSTALPLEESKLSTNQSRWSTFQCLEILPALENPGEDVPDVRTLKEQTAQIERGIAETQQALQAATAELAQDYIKRIQMEKDEKAREVELQRQQRQLRLAKDMVKRQNIEIKELHDNLKTLQLAASSTQSAPSAILAPQRPDGPYRLKARPAPRLVGRPLGPRARAAALLASCDTDISPEAVAVVTPPAPSATLTQTAMGRDQATADGASEQAPRRREQLAFMPTTIVQPKSRTFSSVLASSNKTADTWKLFIP